MLSNHFFIFFIFFFLILSLFIWEAGEMLFYSLDGLWVCGC